MSEETAQTNWENAVAAIGLVSEAEQAQLAEMLRPKSAVSIAGMACRFPGADSLAEFEELLYSSRNAVSEIPPDRWDVDEIYTPDLVRPGQTNSRWAGLVDNIRRFDASFFGIGAQEAARMDPQHRLLLELAWEALEDAGVQIDSLSGSATGVFTALGPSEYSWMQSVDPLSVDLYSGTGIAPSVASGRISYLLDLKGPCISLDTGCSSALVALHLALQSLRSGECDLAIVGAANAVLLPLMSIIGAQTGGSSSDGQCKAFDRDANGYVRAEGAGVVVLSLDDEHPRLATRAWARIEGSATNQDGKTAGLTAPNQAAQTAVVEAALRSAGIEANEVGYIEAHGTGTSLGDPIEIQALRSVMESGNDDRPCLVGSVKTNLGHLEAAAGIAGLIKAAVAVRRAVVPASLHFSEWNENLDMTGARFTVPTSPTDWPAEYQRRIAGVSAFGWAGTNAHVILGEAVQQDKAYEPRPTRFPRVLPISGRSPAAVRESAQRWASTLEQHPERVDSLLWTAASSKTHYELREVVTGTTVEELVEQAASIASTGGKHRRQRFEPRVGFVYSGHGGHWAGMGRLLYESESVFADAIDTCAAEFAKHCSWDLFNELFDETDQSRLQDGAASADVIQPCIFAMQYALTELLADWGVRPHVVLGHSLGEVAAVWASGAIGLAEAAHIVITRSRLANSVATELAMALVKMGEGDLREWLNERPHLDLASVNADQSCTIAGTRADLTVAARELNEVGHEARVLGIIGATHCVAMEPLLPELERELAWVKSASPETQFVSSVEGMDDTSGFEAGYWSANLRRTVRFDTAFRQARAQGPTTFIEIGPHPILMRSMRDLAETPGDTRLLAAMVRGDQPGETIRRTVGALWRDGLSIDWPKIQGRFGFDRQAPSYPWQGANHWSATRRFSTSPDPTGVVEDNAVHVLRTSWIPHDVDTGHTTPALLIEEIELDSFEVRAPNQTPINLAGGDLCAHLQAVLTADRFHVVYCPKTARVSPATPSDVTSATDRLLKTWKVHQSAPDENRARFVLVTRGATGIQHEEMSPAGAALIALARCGRLDDALNPIRTVDIALDADLLDVVEFVEDLPVESAMRANRMNVRRLEPVVAASDSSWRPDEKACYLVTGGIGGVGLHIARWLVTEGAGAVHLVSRGHATADQAKILNELGSRVFHHRVDVADQQKLVEFVGLVDTPEMPLQGVFHAAGVIADERLDMITSESLAAMLRPKTAGAWNLHHATKDCSLQVFALFSSLASVIGSPGQGGYAAANATLDALSAMRRSAGLPACSVAWGPWGETGLSTKWAERIARYGIRTTAPTILIEALAASLATNESSVAVADADLGVLQRTLQAVVPRLLSETVPASSDELVNDAWRTALAANPPDRVGHIEQRLQADLAEFLAIEADEVDPTADWAELGLDSLAAVDISARLHDVGISLSSATMAEVRTIRTLARHIAELAQ